MLRKSFVLVLISMLFSVVQARDPLYDKRWQDPEVEQRIRAGIQANRMGFATFRFVDAQGAPLTNVDMELEQTRHDFLFGCNLFMLGQFPAAEQNRRYEEIFPTLFNHAYLPFLWSDLEPEPGKLRFAVNSPHIYRRPPPDLTVEYCRRHNITAEGHLLIWHSYLPKWLPNDREEVRRLMTKRFEEISARYGQQVKYWDVVDESLHRPRETVLPNDYVFTAMQTAARVFPLDSHLAVGEHHGAYIDYHGDTSPFYLLLQNLQLRNARFDAIEIQFVSHYAPAQHYNPAFHPLKLYEVLDKYADFGRPIHISQVEISSLPAGSEGEADQAVAVRNLYRLWFSHPKVEGIGWWNLADGTSATKSEGKYLPGLLREDLSPKPAFTVLRDLIRKEWWTKLQLNSGSNASLRAQGFYGNYRLTAKHGEKIVQREIHLTKSGVNDFEIRF